MTLLSELGGVRGWVRQRRGAWKKDTDPKQWQDALLFDRAALRVYCWSLAVVPSWLLIDAAKRFRTEGEAPPEQRRIHREMEKAAAWYVAFWCLALVAIWLASPGNDLLAKLLAGVALLRLAEIGNTILGFVLDRREPLLAGSLITVALQALQIALVFAIVDHAFARDDFVIQDGERTGEVATTAFDHLYLSATTMITLGNQYDPATGLARLLELGTATSGIVLLGVVVARAVGLPRGKAASAESLAEGNSSL